MRSISKSVVGLLVLASQAAAQAPIKPGPATRPNTAGATAPVGTSNPAGKPAANGKTAGGKPADLEPDAALRQAIAAHAKAIRAGDFKAAAAFWTAEGDYADPSGKLTPAQKLLNRDSPKASDEGDPPRTTLTLGTVRMASPDLAVEDGTAELVPGKGKSPIKGTYTAVWIRQQGKWLLSSLREHGMGSSAGPGRLTLAALNWLVGHWQAKQDGNSVDVDCHWTPTKSFLLRDITVTHKDGNSHQIHQRIGADSAAGRIRSWSFDADGGTSEGTWEKSGDSWVVTLHGVRSDGTVTSGKSKYADIGDEGFTFETAESRAGGEAQPPIKLRFSRQAADAAASADETPRDPAQQAAREKILSSPAWRQTLYAFRDWISAQPYTPEELSKMKADFKHKTDSLSADELQELLEDSQRKLEILTSQPAEEARQWIAARMALMTRHTPEEISIVRPDILNMTAAQLQQQVTGVQARRAEIARSQTAFNKANRQNLEAINNMFSQEEREREAAINRPAVSMPYGSALGGGVRQYDYKPQTANLGVWVW